MNFKVGDQVVIANKTLSDNIGIYVSEPSWAGKEGEVKEINSEVVAVAHEDNWYWFRKEDLKLKEKTMDNLQVGDVLVDCHGDEATILAVLSKIVGLSNWGDSESFMNWYTPQEMKEDGWKLKGAEPKELTVAEISKELGYDVKVVK